MLSTLICYPVITQTPPVDYQKLQTATIEFVLLFGVFQNGLPTVIQGLLHRETIINRPETVIRHTAEFILSQPFKRLPQFRRLSPAMPPERRQAGQFVLGARSLFLSARIADIRSIVAWSLYPLAQLPNFAFEVIFPADDRVPDGICRIQSPPRG